MMNSNTFDSLPWTPEAKEKFDNIPFFVRSQARTQIERIARDEELDEITVDVVEQARQKFGQ
ncbi:MAG: PCP reductase family protein [Cyanobacteria bacterium J06638_22]